MTKVFQTVHGKLTLALLALLLLVGTFYAGLTLITTRTYLREVNQHLNRALASQLADHLIRKNLLSDDPRAAPAMQAEIKQNMVLNPDIEIYVLDARGRILDFSAAPGAVRLKRVSLGPVRRFLAAVGPLPIYGDDPRNPGQEKIFSAQRIPRPTASQARNSQARNSQARNPQTRNPQTRNPQTRNSQTRNSQTRNRLDGYIYIILGGQQYDQSAGALNRSYILRWSLTALAGVLSVALVTGALFFSVLTRRLRRLSRTMDEFGARYFEGEMAAPRGDEIERLERMFARMSMRIEAQIAALQHSDNYRREIISNVSHDLRTPLAAIQGYLETLQIKEDTLSPQEKRQYLATATRQAQRLNRLISELFELARLESGALELQLEEFSLAELVQDVTQGFQLAAQQKAVHLEIDLGETRPLVRGDIGLIERAMENLIGNALRHTPSGGRVTVMLISQAERAKVRISDTGNGIAPEDLTRIFDRYYRAPRVAGQESTGSAGLGLAITRRIAELHGGTIEVQSAPGQGASFTLDFPVAPRQLKG